MKKNLLVFVSLIAVVAAIAGAYALPETTKTEEPEKIVFVTVQEEIDGFTPDVLEGERVDDPAVENGQRVEDTNIDVLPDTGEREIVVDGFEEDVESGVRLPRCD